MRSNSYRAKDVALWKQEKRRAAKARHFPENTCPASRHVQMMGEYLPLKRGYPMLQEEPHHCAISLLATVAALYEARTRLKQWERDYAGWCVAMLDQGVKSFGTLDDAFKKLTKLRIEVSKGRINRLPR